MTAIGILQVYDILPRVIARIVLPFVVGNSVKLSLPYAKYSTNLKIKNLYFNLCHMSAEARVGWRLCVKQMEVLFSLFHSVCLTVVVIVLLCQFVVWHNM